MVRAMRIPTALLALMPLAATANGDFGPLLFSYDTTLATCITEPTAPDLAGACAEALSASYILRRATARAAAQCDGQPLQNCPTPFEEQGLPAIAMRIATEVDCDATPMSDATALPLSPDHCISIAADILFDEGVVPLDSALSCAFGTECKDLARINATFWADAVTALAGDDPTIPDLQARNAIFCHARPDDIGADVDMEIDLRALHGSEPDPMTDTTASLVCMAKRSAAIWADLISKE